MGRGLFKGIVPMIAIVAGVALLWLLIQDHGRNDDFQQRIDAYDLKIDSLQRNIDRLNRRDDSIGKVNLALKEQIQQKDISIITIQQKYDKVRSGLAHLSTDEHIQFFTEQISQ